MLDYFNLNTRARKAWGEAAKRAGARDASGLVREGQLSPGQQLTMYVGLFVGVLFSAAVSQFRSGEDITLALTTGKVIGSAIIALMIIPHVYGKLRLDPESPLLVQFGLFVQNGVFWSVIVDLASEAV
ncbi:MAG: hypothetical protein HXS44_12610 [Theionarchaea archaeon]|nr:hypothetical protein [Theionarchaea archaeon]